LFTRLRQGGYTALDLRASGISGRQILSVGRGLWSWSDLLEAGYSMSEVDDNVCSRSADVDVHVAFSSELQSLEEPESPAHSASSDYIGLQFDLKSM
jgi:hypothetical protein